MIYIDWHFGFPEKIKQNEEGMVFMLRNPNNYQYLPSCLNTLEFHKKLYDIHKCEFYKNKLRKYILNYL